MRAGWWPSRLPDEVSLTVRRTNEYTTWRGRIDRGDNWRTVVWGPLIVSWRLPLTPAQRLADDLGEASDEAWHKGNGYAWP